MEPSDSMGQSKSSDPKSSNDSDISVADIYNFVKKNNDKFESNSEYPSKFSPQSVHPALLNEDGTPKVFYHQTENDFTVFDIGREGAGTRDNETPFGIFLKSSDKDIGLRGKKQMPLYVQARSPLTVKNRYELVQQLKRMSDVMPPEILKKISEVLNNPIVITEYIDKNGIHSANV